MKNDKARNYLAWSCAIIAFIELMRWYYDKTYEGLYIVQIALLIASCVNYFFAKSK